MDFQTEGLLLLDPESELELAKQQRRKNPLQPARDASGVHSLPLVSAKGQKGRMNFQKLRRPFQRKAMLCTNIDPLISESKLL